jgi:hypothetical protein
MVSPRKPIFPYREILRFGPQVSRNERFPFLFQFFFLCKVELPRNNRKARFSEGISFGEL